MGHACPIKIRQGAMACKAQDFSEGHIEGVVLDALRDVVLRPEHFRDLVRLGTHRDHFGLAAAQLIPAAYKATHPSPGGP